METKKIILSPWYIKRYLGVFLYMVLSIVLGLYLRDGLILFLTWNMALVGFVLFLTHVIKIYYHKKSKNIYKVIFLVLWILFFPNTYYILTDLIHFQVYPFFMNYSDIYYLDLNTWLVFFHILIGSMYAMKIGIDTIDEMRGILKVTSKKVEYSLITILFIASSVAIYLGRFIRLNSWQILQIGHIINDVINHFSFFIGFVFLFVIIHFLTYSLFSKYQDQKI